jgi:hypothetical protein
MVFQGSRHGDTGYFLNTRAKRSVHASCGALPSRRPIAAVHSPAFPDTVRLGSSACSWMNIGAPLGRAEPRTGPSHGWRPLPKELRGQNTVDRRPNMSARVAIRKASIRGRVGRRVAPVRPRGGG